MDKLDHPIYTLVSLLVKTHKPLDPQNQLTCLNRASYLLKNKEILKNLQALK